MKKRVIFATFVIFSILFMLNVVSASPLSSCQNISSSGIYTLTQNVSSSGTCMNITSANVILDCNGYTINFSSSSQGDGVYSNSVNTTVKNCVILPSAEVDYSYGIAFNGADEGLIENSRVASNGFNTAPIYFQGADYNRITNTNVTCSGGYCAGMIFESDATHNDVANLRISGTYGMFLKGDSNTFVNVNSITLLDNIYFQIDANYNTFTDSYLESATSGGALVWAADHNSFINSVLIGGYSIEINDYGGEVNFTNCTIDPSNYVVRGGSSNRFWYVDAYVNDSNGNALSGANVFAYDVNSVLNNLGLTNSSGYIPRTVLKEYTQNSSGRYHDSNYALSATKSGYSYDVDSGPLNMTTNRMGSNKVWITLTDDGALTALFGTNPADSYNSNSSSMTFDLKCSYNSAVQTIQLWTNTTGTWAVNYTNSSYTNNTWLNITVPGIQNGKFKWAVFCNISSGSSDWTENRTFNVDTTLPTVEQGTNPVDNYNNSRGIITFDLKCSDNVGVDTIQLWGNWSGTWQAIYSNSSYTNNTWLNITLQGIPNGKFKWAVYCRDTSGSGNWTSNRTFNVTDGSHVSACADIKLSGIYILNQSVSSEITCFNVFVDDVILDCNGNNISFSSNWSNEGNGVYSNSSNTTVKNCIIRETADADDSYGIEYDGASYGLIDNNSITVNNGGYYISGVFLKNADYNIITNINITSGGYGSIGLRMDGADYNNITNLKEIGTWNGISLAGDEPNFGSSYHNNFFNVSSITTQNSLRIGIGNYLEIGSAYNTFTNCYLESTEAHSLFASDSDYTSFINTVLTGIGSISFNQYAGEYNFTNCTITGVMSTEGGRFSLNRFWYADVYVNDSSGNPLSGANVTSKDKNNVLKNWSLTKSSGYTPRLALRQYMQNSSGKYYDTNYTFNGSKLGYNSNSKSINLTSNAIPGDLGKVILTLTSAGDSRLNISSFEDYTIVLPNSVTLAALVFNEGSPESDVSVSWSQISGPGAATFSDSSKTITDVSFSASGDYVLELSATNGTISNSQYVYVTVLPEPIKIQIKKSGTGSGNVTSSGTGINCGSDCSQNFDDETLVTLTATPSSGSVFAGWVGGGCLGNSSDTCTVNVNGTKEVTAFFDKNTTGIHVYYVATDGSDSNNGSIDFPWLTIQHAADTAMAGDKVIVKAGTYNEFLTFPNSGNSTSPIVFEGERNANGEWLTIVDPSTNASSGWVAAPEIGDGVYKKDVGFVASELTINNKRVAYVPSMGNISTINFYNNTNWTTGADLLSVPENTLIYMIPTWGSHLIRFWDGMEALWGHSGNTVYLRLRNGTNPNGMGIGVASTSDWFGSATFLISDKSYLDFRNFNVRGASDQFFLTSNTHHITTESNNLSTGYSRVYLYSGPYQNIIRNNEITENFYGYNGPGAWESTSADYHWALRGYQYLISKFIMGGGGTQDEAILLYTVGDNNTISGNHVSKGLGSGIDISGTDYDHPAQNTDIYDNTIENEASVGILLITGHTNTRVHDNLLIDNNINMRFHRMDAWGELNRTVYVYKNKLWLPTGIGAVNIFMNFQEGGSYHPVFWVYHNSFSGGAYDFDARGTAELGGVPGLNFLNNIFSGATDVANLDSEVMENASMMGVYDYNLRAAQFSWRVPEEPVWYGENNFDQSSPLWSLYEVPDFSLEENSIAIDSGIDLSHNFTINGTNYTALPGMESGYFLGSAPDMGAVEYDDSVMVISRNAPENNYATNSSSITFEFKCLYNSGVDSIQLWTNSTGTWHANYTNNSYTSNTWLNITRIGISQGTWKWAVYCDASDTSDWTGNRTFTVDLIDPIAEQGTNPIAGYQDSAGSMTFDLRCSDDVAVSSIQLLTDISGTLQAEYSNFSYQNNTWLNITLDGITAGDYVWQVYCEDRAGNSYQTSSRTFSSTYSEEEQENDSNPPSVPPAGGGGGGGGGAPALTNTTNVTNTTQVNIIPNKNPSNGGNQIGSGTSSSSESAGAGISASGHKTDLTWLWATVGILVFSGILTLILALARKKKEVYHKNYRYKKVQRY